MSARVSMLRRVASALVGHAAKVLPAARSSWSEGMTHEIAHIENDLAALMWAVGCVVASYRERSGGKSTVYPWYARGLLALLGIGHALIFLFATALTLAYRLQYLVVAALLGGFTPGDDYRRFVPLMDVTPWWIHVLWIVASALFFDSAWKLVRNRRAAFPIFAAAWVLGTVGDLFSHSMPAYREVFAFSAPQFARDYVMPVATALVPVIMAAALWRMARGGPRPRANPEG
jgi:hypothetical protein